MTYNHDNLIIKIFFTSKNKINPRRTRIIQNYPNILNYLLNRYEGCKSIREILYCIKTNIQEIPRCPICGNYLKSRKGVFQMFCSKKCSANSNYRKEKIKNTCINKYGVDNVNKLEKIQEKKRKTWKDNYGCDSPFQSPIIKQKIKYTLMTKYGVDNANKSKEIRKKYENTCLKRYGVKCPSKSEKVKNIAKKNCFKKYGVINVNKLEYIQQKRNNTKRKNHTFNTSSTEDKIYDMLCPHYEVHRNWNKDERYPWMCDFYIEGIDLFIECNFHWTHGGHPFNSNSIKDQVKLEQWKSKQTKYYDNAIETWTKRDIKKRNKAKEEKLNYVELWSYKEAIEWINENLL